MADEGNKYKLLFETGGQLVPGNQVLVGGQPIGTVDDITLTDDSQAEVDITVDEPLHEGTTARHPRDLALGDRQPLCLDLAGPQHAPELPDGATLPADKTTSPVDLDQLFDTFDTKTAPGCSNFIQGRPPIYTGNNRRRARTYKYFAPSLQATSAPVRRADPGPAGAQPVPGPRGRRCSGRSPSAATTSRR